MNINDWVLNIHELAVKKKWYEPMREFMDEDYKFIHCDITSYSDTELAYISQQLLLVATEIGEATQALRNCEDTHFIEEITDVLIRTLSLLGCFRVDVDRLISKKHEFNELRPEHHKKRF